MRVRSCHDKNVYFKSNMFCVDCHWELKLPSPTLSFFGQQSAHVCNVVLLSPSLICVIFQSLLSSVGSQRNPLPLPSCLLWGTCPLFSLHGRSRYLFVPWIISWLCSSYSIYLPWSRVLGSDLLCIKYSYIFFSFAPWKRKTVSFSPFLSDKYLISWNAIQI